MISKGVMASGAVAASLLAAALIAGPASASAKETVTLTIPSNHVTANKTFQIKYSSAHVPAGAILMLQRQFGSAHVWKRIKKLAGTKGTAYAPTVAMGKYAYRIYVSKPHKPYVIAKTSGGRTVYSYGSVPLSAICNIPSVLQSGSCGLATAQVGTTVFAYEIWARGASYPSYAEALSVPKTTCRSVTLYFAQVDPLAPEAAYVQLVQSASDPQTASTPSNAVGTTTARLDGGPWILDVAVGGGTDAVGLNGTFNCYTTSGF